VNPSCAEIELSSTSMQENLVVPFPSALKVLQSSQVPRKQHQGVRKPIAGEEEGKLITRLSNQIGKNSSMDSLLPQKQSAPSTTEGKLQIKSELAIS
jgi:hypothetical protein